MSDHLIRAVVAAADIQGDGRTLIARIAPYNKPATVNDGFGPYTEMFEPGAFKKVTTGAPRRLRLFTESHQGAWVGRGDRWLDSDEGLSVAFRLDDTEAGRAAGFKISDGQLPGVSMAYIPGRSVERDGVVRRVSVKAIAHVALCELGQHSEAKVTSLRDAVLGDSTPMLDDLQRWLASVKRT